MIENFDESVKDAVLGFAQIQSEKEEEQISQNTRAVAHEVRNQLSICDLYTEIIKKTCAKQGINDESILNAVKSLSKSVKMAGNSLIALKSTEKAVIKPHKLKDLIKTSEDLTKVYFEGKNIEYIVENNTDKKIPVDENKFVAAIINLVKNASEAFNKSGDELEVVSNGKKPYVKVKTEENEDFVLIRISNNAGKIENPENIFKEGYTTKSAGSGLGLMICKKSIEEVYGKLELEKNTDEETEFVITIGKVN